MISLFGQPFKDLITRIGGSCNFSGEMADIRPDLDCKWSLLHNKFVPRGKILRNCAEMYLNEIPQAASAVLVSQKFEKKLNILRSK